MKSYFILILINLLGKYTSAQNLIPNGSFESYGVLPCGLTNNQSGFMAAINDWTLPSFGTSDIYSTLVSPNCIAHCNTTSTISPGHQFPRTGNVMASIETYNVLNNREYLEIPLLLPLSIGQNYYAEFYCSRAEKVKYATNNFGMYFSDTLINAPTFFVLNFIPQINETAIITDTSNWVKVSGTFVATSAAQYLIIGNFFDNINTLVTPFSNTTFNTLGYYYIDDVAVTMATGTNFLNNNHSFHTSPNPVSSFTNITAEEFNNATLVLYDFIGRRIYQSVFNERGTINMSEFNKGVYFFELSDIKGKRLRERIVKN